MSSDEPSAALFVEQPEIEILAQEYKLRCMMNRLSSISERLAHLCEIHPDVHLSEANVAIYRALLELYEALEFDVRLQI